MASVQSLAMTAIMGALRTVVTDVLDLHAKVMPMYLLNHSICYRSAMWLASLSEPHPLEPIYKIRSRRCIKKHRSALHEIEFMYNMELGRVEKVLCYNVVQCTALLNLEPRRVRTLASAHALHLTTLYECPSISSAFVEL